MEYLIIDGYNIINAWKDLFNLENESLEECRIKMLNMLSNYQGFKKANVIVVFDAHLVKGSQQKREMFDNVTVIYTKEHETADNYIERFVYKHGNMHRVRVATSDYLEQTIVLAKGGIRMTARELRQEIEAVVKNVKVNTPNGQDKSNTIMSRINPDLYEKLEKIRRSKF